MKLKELRKKEGKDLMELLSQYRDKLRELRFKIANKQLRNIREVRETKKVIAQILTLLKK